MTYPHPIARPVILRARRDTIGLVLMATLSTFALAHVVQSHRASAPVGPPGQAVLQQADKVWTGGLSGVAVPEANPTTAGEPLTSASLVVPELALPQAPVQSLVKLRGCGGDSCKARPPRTASVPTPPRKLATEKETTEETIVAIDGRTSSDRAPPRREKRSLVARLNPFTHLPGASTIRRPFTIASDTVSGWFKRF